MWKSKNDYNRKKIFEKIPSYQQTEQLVLKNAKLYCFLLKLNNLVLIIWKECFSSFLQIAKFSCLFIFITNKHEIRAKLKLKLKAELIAELIAVLVTELVTESVTELVTELTTELVVQLVVEFIAELVFKNKVFVLKNVH